MADHCPFCDSRDALFANDGAYVKPDRFPVSPGHVLIIPYRHISDYFATSHDERLAILELLDKAKAWLDREQAPAGYNIGINCGAAAGQTVLHVHVHVIPRYKGDVSDPRGGVRGVIPARQKY